MLHKTSKGSEVSDSFPIEVQIANCLILLLSYMFVPIEQKREDDELLKK